MTEPVESIRFEGQHLGSYDVQEILVDLIDPPAEQLRIDLEPEGVEELAQSIGREGLINVPTVEAVEDRYRVVAGHRRIEAVRLLGWRTMPVRVQRMENRSRVALGAHENLFRADLSPIEEAGAVQALLEESGGEVDFCARRINRTRGWVDSRLRMLRWPPDIQTAVHAGQISAAAGAELAGVTDDVHRRFLLGHAVEGGATARTCQAWRIAWLQTGTVPDLTVTQVGPGRTAPAPVEAELPCYLCGDRVGYGSLMHVWLETGCFEVFQEFSRAWREVPGAGAVPEVPGSAAG